MGTVPPRPLKPRAKVDYDAIEWPIGRSGVSEIASPRVMLAEHGIRDSENYEALTDWQGRLLRAGVISPDGDRTNYDWSLTTQKAADALIRVFGGAQPAEPEPVGDSSSGIALCGYEEL